MTMQDWAETPTHTAFTFDPTLPPPSEARDPENTDPALVAVGYAGRHLAKMLGRDYDAMDPHERGHWDAVAFDTLAAYDEAFERLADAAEGGEQAGTGE